MQENVIQGEVKEVASLHPRGPRKLHEGFGLGPKAIGSH